MKFYLKNILRSIAYGSCFGIIYNSIVYFMSARAFEFMTDNLRLFPAVFFYNNANDETLFFLLAVMKSNALIIVLDGIISGFGLMILANIVFFPFIKNIKNFEIKQRIWFKMQLFFLITILFSAILVLLASYIWALANKDISWFSKDVIFERYLTAIWMYENRYIYSFVALGITSLYSLRIKRIAFR